MSLDCVINIIFAIHTMVLSCVINDSSVVLAFKNPVLRQDFFAA